MKASQIFNQRLRQELDRQVPPTSISKLACQVGVSPEGIRKNLNGISVASLDRAEQLAQALGCTLIELLTEVTETGK